LFQGGIFLQKNSGHESGVATAAAATALPHVPGTAARPVLVSPLTSRLFPTKEKNAKNSVQRIL